MAAGCDQYPRQGFTVRSVAREKRWFSKLTSLNPTLVQRSCRHWRTTAEKKNRDGRREGDGGWRAGHTYKEIAKTLDLMGYNIENCAKIVKLMEAAGIAEPYRRLTEKPDRLPQWCSKHWMEAGNRKGGGKRRRAS